jgi:hypothetical protein
MVCVREEYKTNFRKDTGIGIDPEMSPCGTKSIQRTELGLFISWWEN